MKYLSSFLFVLLLAAPVLARMEVHVGEDVDMSALRTYRWGQGVPADKVGVEKQIVRVVDTQMQAQGLELVSDDSADLDVATFVLTDTNVEAWGAVAATGWGTVWSYQVRDITNGTLVVRITRAGTQDMVWHVMEQQVVEPGLTSAQIERKVDRIIQKMFKKYPRVKKK